MEITKEQLINIWNLYCNEKLEDANAYTTMVTKSQGHKLDILKDFNYSIKINDTLSLMIENSEFTNMLTISLIFSGFLRHKSFELSLDEFSELEINWSNGESRASQKFIQNTLSAGLNELEKILV